LRQRFASVNEIMTKQPGILNDQQIAALFDKKHLRASRKLDVDQIQPASLDLRLGTKAWRVRASFLPGKDNSVASKLKRFGMHQIDLREGAVLETGCVYIVPLLEKFALPKHLSASANPKSSTGRLDIFTRVIADNTQQFDMVPAGYDGPLYLEISPRTFPIVVKTGSRLSQIRFRQGSALLDSAELLDLHRKETLVAAEEPNISDRGIAMSCDVLDYWEPIYNRGSQDIVLDPDEFYILVSREAVHVPPSHAAEMVPFDPLVGEFRVHYAGFFDPGFGHAKAGGEGARAVLEVRSHEVPFILEHGQIVGRLVYERMLKKPKALYGADLKSNYQAQGLKLSKHFR